MSGLRMTSQQNLQEHKLQKPTTSPRAPKKSQQAPIQHASIEGPRKTRSMVRSVCEPSPGANRSDWDLKESTQTEGSLLAQRGPTPSHYKMSLSYRQHPHMTKKKQSTQAQASPSESLPENSSAGGSSSAWHILFHNVEGFKAAVLLLQFMLLDGLVAFQELAKEIRAEDVRKSCRKRPVH